MPKGQNKENKGNSRSEGTYNSVYTDSTGTTYRIFSTRQNGSSRYEFTAHEMQPLQETRVTFSGSTFPKRS